MTVGRGKTNDGSSGVRSSGFGGGIGIGNGVKCLCGTERLVYK